MDIEQPEFASPQHAVLVKLTWTLSSVDTADGHLSVLERTLNDRRMDDASLVFRFCTKIHLRYPSPVDTARFLDSTYYLPSSLYEPILLPAPTWVSGKVICETQQPPFQRTLLLYGSSRWHLFGYVPTLCASKNCDRVTFSTATWVAAAARDDFIPVATLTVLFSLLGACMLGYETSKLAHL